MNKDPIKTRADAQHTHSTHSLSHAMHRDMAIGHTRHTCIRPATVESIWGYLWSVRSASGCCSLCASAVHFDNVVVVVHRKTTPLAVVCAWRIASTTAKRKAEELSIAQFALNGSLKTIAIHYWQYILAQQPFSLALYLSTIQNALALGLAAVVLHKQYLFSTVVAVIDFLLWLFIQ